MFSFLKSKLIQHPGFVLPSHSYTTKATPGRLLEMIKLEKIELSQVRTFILDEADRMLEMGFEKDVRQIAQDLSPHPKLQTLLFSATFPKSIKLMVEEFLHNYVSIKIGKSGTAVHTIEQFVQFVPDNEKIPTLFKILKTASGLTLIFVERKTDAQNLNQLLEKRGFKTNCLHGDMSQTQREAALLSFKQKTAPLLVATSLASRGLDIPEVSMVISFDLPKNIDDYIHRIGRTGRIGQSGKAISFYNEKNQNLAVSLLQVLRRSSKLNFALPI